MRPSSDTSDAVDLIRTAKEDAPDDYLPFLIWEYGLEELLPYLPDPRVALNNGLQWQPIRGTPASLTLALSWLGVTAVIEEDDPTSVHWYEFQLATYTQESGRHLLEDGGYHLLANGARNLLDYPRECLIPDRPLLRNIVGLARLSAPVGTRLKRMYCEGDCDVRRFILDQSDWGDILSDDSGYYDAELDVKLSYCRTTQTVAFCEPVTATTAITSVEDGWSLSTWDDRDWSGE